MDAKIPRWKAMAPDMNADWTPGLDVSGEMVELVDVVRPGEYRDVFQRGLSFHQLSLGAGHRAGPVGEARIVRAGIACCRMLEEGRLTVPVLETIPPAEAVTRLDEIRERRSVGKTVVVR